MPCTSVQVKIGAYLVSRVMRNCDFPDTNDDDDDARPPAAPVAPAAETPEGNATSAEVSAAAA